MEMWISSRGMCTRFFALVVPLLQVITKASCMGSFPLYACRGQESLSMPWTNYSAFVVFGDSYSDNGHPRSTEYRASLARKPSAGGRFSDGPVWNEHLAQKLSNLAGSNLTFINYAYNGAFIDNRQHKLPVKPVPDTAAQIKNYLNDLGKYLQHPVSEKVFGGRILHALWIGINPLVMIWISVISDHQELGDSDTFLTPKLVAQLDKQVEELRGQLVELLNKPSLSECQADHMIMTIPPLTHTMLASLASSHAAKQNHTLARHNIQLLGRLTDHFNTKLVETIQGIQSQCSKKKGRIAVFNTAKFWNSVSSTPQKFGIHSLDACYPNPEKPPCKQPRQHMYWDILHPSSTMHDSLSTAIMEFLHDLKD